MQSGIEEINSILASPVKKEVLGKATRLEARLRFHSTIYNDISEIYQPATIFLDWVKTLLAKDKYRVFLSLFKFPLVTIPFINELFADMEAVFEGKNPSAIYRFSDNGLQEDWFEYRQEVLGEPQIWRERGWDMFKYAINCFVVVRCPKPEVGSMPEPYFYFIDTQNVIDYWMAGNNIEWIIYREDDRTLIYIDSYVYRAYETEPGDDSKVTNLLWEVNHDLEYCPVRHFWTDRLNPICMDIKRSPLSSFLSNLDWLLFFSVSKNHLDLYASYPVYSSYAADCSFKNNETGDYCDGGYLRNSNDQYIVLQTGSLIACPICSNKRLTGAGSFIEVPIPIDGVPDMRNPVNITTVDRSSLDYNVSEIFRLKQEIREGVTGRISEVLDKTSVTDTQIQSSYDNRTFLLNNLKRNFEIIQKFVDDTVCKLRYGDDFIESQLSLGDDFYVYTLENLNDKYVQSKKNRFDVSELDQISKEMIRHKYKNNPLEFERMSFLSDLEPYRHYTLGEIGTMYDKGLINIEDITMKLNFSEYIKRFEYENGNITEFGKDLNYGDRLNIITNKLKDYGRRSIKKGGFKTSEEESGTQNSGRDAQSNVKQK